MINMFEHLEVFRQIVVTGPQRSGTNICAKAIAFSLGYKAIDERLGNFLHRSDDLASNTDIKIILHKNLCQQLLQEKVVLQCPYASCLCHQLPKHVAVVFMMRSIEDIIASQKRISWRGRALELVLLGKSSGEPCEIKYENWKWQKVLIKHAFEVQYSDLKNHPLWVDQHLRTFFLPRQTSIHKIL